ncbi:MAG: hypothetical protein V1854_01075 [Methanobacteriota archaeon]
MSEQEQTKVPQEARTKDSNSSPIAITGLPVSRDRTGKAVRKPKKIVHLRRNKFMRKGYKEPEKQEIDFWTKEDDKLLKRVNPCQTADEIQKLFPNRTPDAISARASRDLHLKKDPETKAIIQSMNSSKPGLANFADHPLETLARKYPDLKLAYDEMVEKLLMHPSVDPNNILQVEMIKEAILSKITQFLMMRARIENNCKGKTLIINPKTGFEQWVESRYLHGPDIMNDAKLSRTILKDLGIIQERERKVEVIGNLKMLWERESDDREDDVAVIDAEAKRVD